MISVGIDVSKGKSMVCILKPNEDYVCKPFDSKTVLKGQVSKADY